jgi:CRISPR-associated protein Csc1
MAVHIYRADLTLMEHTYFASREIGTLYESEPLIGNYALTYALGFCSSPYDWDGPPRYKQDLAPLNERGLYVTPATFQPNTLRYVFSQFNALSDSFYFRFDQNAIATDREKKARAANFPQAGKIRMLGVGSQAVFYLLSLSDDIARFPSYIRLGKFMSKARILWNKLSLASPQTKDEEHDVPFFLNAADLPPTLLANMRVFSIYNVHPAPLLSHCRLYAPFWQATNRDGKPLYLPAGMSYGVEEL